MPADSALAKANEHQSSLSALDLLEAFHLCHVVFSLHDLGIFAGFQKAVAPEVLARRKNLDAALLSGLCDYAALRTNLIEKVGTRFRTTAHYSTEARFLLDLYYGAFGTRGGKLGSMLRGALPPNSPAVNLTLHARAFSHVDKQAPRWEAAIAHQIGFTETLDLGCGPGALLLQLASANPSFTGWGLERNARMCQLARKNVASAELKSRVKILRGDSSHLRQLRPSVKNGIRSLTACQVANEMFATGPAQAAAWLAQIKRVFPGRPMLLSDYYGRLGSKDKHPDRRTLLHDHAQLISGQGIPPSSLRAWRRIYDQAGCRLIHVIEDQDTTRFAHLLML